MFSDYVADSFVEFVVGVFLESIFKNSVTLLDVVVADLSISHQDDIDELTIDDSLGDNFWRCSSVSCH
jgi:hypothetical protein